MTTLQFTRIIFVLIFPDTDLYTLFAYPNINLWTNSTKQISNKSVKFTGYPTFLFYNSYFSYNNRDEALGRFYVDV